MVDLSDFIVGMWTIFAFLKWASSSHFTQLFQLSTPEFEFHNRKRTQDKTLIFGCSKYSFKQINPFVPNASFLYPLKTVRFSGVFRGQRNGALGMNGLITSVYRKSTFAWRLQNYNKFVPFTYTKGFTETLIDWSFRYNNTHGMTFT